MSENKLNTEKIDSTTQTEINHWDLDLSKNQPEPYHYGGKANAGKILKVSNDGFIRLATGGGGGATYTGTNGVTVDNVNYTIGLDTTSTTTPEIANLKILGDLVGDNGSQVDFSDCSDVDLGVGCTANPKTASSDPSLSSITINGTDYRIESGSTVTANPTVTSKDTELSSIRINGTAYYVNTTDLSGTRAGSATELGSIQLYNGSKYNVSQVSANPTLAGTETSLTSLKVNGTDYKIDSGTTVEANPTLAGTESELQGLKVGTTSYKVDRVSVSSTGTSTTNLPSYITINGTEYKFPESYISTTWSELKALRDAGTLVAGTYYRITDYVATTTQTNTQSASHQFDLIVFATANNKLQENCYAIQHSGDTYFANSELLSWDVWYCLDNDTNRFAWADSTNGKGVIYYLKDEFNNSAWYDWKGIQVKNSVKTDRFYYLFDNSGVDASLSSSTSFPSVYGNELGFFINSNKYEIGCNIFVGNNFSNNTIGNYFYYNTIGNYFSYNTIGNRFSNNTIGNYFYNNTIGNDFYHNTIGNNFRNNTIGNDFGDNTIGTSSTDIYYKDCRFGDGIQYVDITDYGTSSAKKSGIELPSGLAGTSSTHKSITSLTNNTTYYLNQQQIS